MDDIRGPQDETPHERDSRRLRELLEETRVAMPGVQVLFAFLLAVPFQQRFEELSRLERDLYVVSLLSAAAATALFIAPSAFHRLRFRRRDKAFLVVLGNRMVIAGLAMLLVAMNSAVFVVASFILDGTTPVVVASATTGVFVLLWFVLGLARGRTDDD
jgi:O-antigen/teichoic acid export membrane protein